MKGFGLVPLVEFEYTDGDVSTSNGDNEDSQLKTQYE